MARDRLTFRQRDVTAALKAVKAAGVSIARVKITRDGVEIVPGEPGSETTDLDAERTLMREALQNYVEEPSRPRRKAPAGRQ